MGNRAVIAFTGGPGSGRGEVHNNTPCVYLHWNGGRASVEGFLEAARTLGYHNPHSTETERRDGFARLVQAWFGSGSVYIGPYFQQDTDNWDNGTYVVDGRLQIVERRFTRDKPEEVDAEKTQKIREQCLAKAYELGGWLSSVELAS